MDETEPRQTREMDNITAAHCCVRLGGRAGVSYVPCVLVEHYRRFNPGRVVLRTKLVSLYVSLVRCVVSVNLR